MEKNYKHASPSNITIQHGRCSRRSLKTMLLFIFALAAGSVFVYTELEHRDYNIVTNIQLIVQQSMDALEEILSSSATDVSNVRDLCVQADELVPQTNSKLWEQLSVEYESSEFKYEAVEWLEGAVRIPTESFDRMQPVGEDPRWEVFGPFHDYLLGAFPLIHSTLKLTKVNTYGLLYHWQGSEASLKPLLLTAHQDVVPVDTKTVKLWKYPPFSGYFDGERIWGRGTSDDKSGLIGIMTAVESLLRSEFVPSRTIVLAFGFDEEIGGPHGAKSLAKALLSTYGENSMAMLVDEGGNFGLQYGAVFAVPGVAEKGNIDIRIEINAPGGHSSIPPDHTSIGMLSSILSHLEKHPPQSSLGRENPIYQTIQCLAVHAPKLPRKLRSQIIRSAKSDGALKRVQEYFFSDRAVKSLIGTTQAIDLIEGGVKANALPEQAWAVVDHRVSIQSSPAAVKNRTTELLKVYAAEFNLSMTAFASDVHIPGVDSSSSYGSLVLTDAFGTALEAAPIAPTDFTKSSDAEPYKLLAGTIRSTFKRHRKLVDVQKEKDDDLSDITVAPGYMSGNTDTRYYWDLTPHIFRYNHLNSGLETNSGLGRISPGVHTVNESILVDAFIEQILFFTTLILNVDETPNF